jgi:hypothetical protein
MAKVSFAVLAANFGAIHTVAVIGMMGNRIDINL